MAVAIDYTASNGDISDPKSLHAMNNNNQYYQAINQVGQILEVYDYDANFPTFGFGGVPKHLGLKATSHCFALNGNPNDPNIHGVNGILQAYQNTLSQISLSGPTRFSEVL